MDLKGRKSINKAVFTWAVAALLLLIMATPALSTLFAAPGSVNTKAIVKGAVKTKKIANGAVNSAKIKDGSIKNGDIAANAAIAASKINLNGTVMVGGLAYKSPQTRTLTISAPAFSSKGDPLNDHSGVTDGYIYSIAGANFQASVNLPQGAKITNIRYWLYNNVAAAEVWGQMWRTTRAPSGFSWTEMSRVELTANSTNWAVLDDASIASPVIDNNANSYVIQAKFFDSSPDVRFSAAIITYEVQAPE